MPTETLKAWAAAPPHAALHLPPPNRFLPDDLTLLPASPTAAASPAAAAAAADDDDDTADTAAAAASAPAVPADAASASVSARPRRPTRLSPLDAAGRTVWHLDGDAYARPRGSALVLLLRTP